MGRGRPHQFYHTTMLRMTEEQWEDLTYLAKCRKETRSESLRACLVAVVNQAKRKGMWKDGYDTETREADEDSCQSD